MNYILAVSGGIDSVVLLHYMVQRGGRFVVAHFDHGMRPESSADARFVAALAAHYGLPFVSRREELAGQGEAAARRRRYRFLHEVAQEYNGRIVTAHHRDDAVETIALNIQRGTRWRGVAGMSDPRLERPLSAWSKRAVYEYAAAQRLEWVEDATNQSPCYTRNRLRRRLGQCGNELLASKLYELWQKQRRLRAAIEQEGRALLPQLDSRYFVIMAPESAAQELLYQRVLEVTGVSLLSSQLAALLIAIKTGRPGTVWQPAGGVRVKLSRKNVTIERVD